MKYDTYLMKYDTYNTSAKNINIITIYGDGALWQCST